MGRVHATLVDLVLISRPSALGTAARPARALPPMSGVRFGAAEQLQGADPSGGRGGIVPREKHVFAPPNPRPQGSMLGLDQRAKEKRQEETQRKASQEEDERRKRVRGADEASAMGSVPATPAS